MKKNEAIFVSPSSAAAGTTIAIYGSGFAEGLGAATAPTVKFGGVTATGVTVVSDTELTATIPAQSGATDCVTADEGVRGLVIKLDRALE